MWAHSVISKAFSLGRPEQMYEYAHDENSGRSILVLYNRRFAFPAENAIIAKEGVFRAALCRNILGTILEEVPALERSHLLDIKKHYENMATLAPMPKAHSPHVSPTSATTVLNTSLLPKTSLESPFWSSMKPPASEIPVSAPLLSSTSLASGQAPATILPPEQNGPLPNIGNIARTTKSPSSTQSEVAQPADLRDVRTDSSHQYARKGNPASGFPTASLPFASALVNSKMSTSSELPVQGMTSNSSLSATNGMANEHERSRKRNVDLDSLHAASSRKRTHESAAATCFESTDIIPVRSSDFRLVAEYSKMAQSPPPASALARIESFCKLHFGHGNKPEVYRPYISFELDRNDMVLTLIAQSTYTYTISLSLSRNESQDNDYAKEMLARNAIQAGCLSRFIKRTKFPKSVYAASAEAIVKKYSDLRTIDGAIAGSVTNNNDTVMEKDKERPAGRHDAQSGLCGLPSQSRRDDRDANMSDHPLAGIIDPSPSPGSHISQQRSRTPTGPRMYPLNARPPSRASSRQRSRTPTGPRIATLNARSPLGEDAQPLRQDMSNTVKTTTTVSSRSENAMDKSNEDSGEPGKRRQLSAVGHAEQQFRERKPLVPVLESRSPRTIGQPMQLRPQGITEQPRREVELKAQAREQIRKNAQKRIIKGSSIGSREMNPNGNLDRTVDRHGIFRGRDQELGHYPGVNDVLERSESRGQERMRVLEISRDTSARDARTRSRSARGNDRNARDWEHGADASGRERERERERFCESVSYCTGKRRRSRSRSRSRPERIDRERNEERPKRQSESSADDGDAHHATTYKRRGLEEGKGIDVSSIAAGDLNGQIMTTSREPLLASACADNSDRNVKLVSAIVQVSIS